MGGRNTSCFSRQQGKAGFPQSTYVPSSSRSPNERARAEGKMGGPTAVVRTAGTSSLTGLMVGYGWARVRRKRECGVRGSSDRGAAMQNVIITYAETNPSTEKLTKLTTGSCCCIVLMTCIARSTRRVPPRIAISNLVCPRAERSDPDPGSERKHFFALLKLTNTSV